MADRPRCVYVSKWPRKHKILRFIEVLQSKTLRNISVDENCELNATPTKLHSFYMPMSLLGQSCEIVFEQPIYIYMRYKFVNIQKMRF